MTDHLFALAFAAAAAWLTVAIITAANAPILAPY